MKKIILALTLLINLFIAPVNAKEDGFYLSSNMQIETNKKTEIMADYLNDRLSEYKLVNKKLKKSSSIQTGIRLKIDTSLEKQEYTLHTENSLATITARDNAGLLYGINDFYQYLKVKGHLPKMNISYIPYTKNRAVLLDCARKYYTKDEIKDLLLLMAKNSLNQLSLHFSEESGLRIENPEYPWLAGSDIALSRFPNAKDADMDKYLTYSELKEIVEYAHSLQIEIIPSFDSPGHMGYLLNRYLQYSLLDFRAQFSIDGIKGEKLKDTLDLSNPDARQYVESIILSYAKMFYDMGCRKFDLGGDEMLGTERVNIQGKTKPAWQALDTWKEEIQNITQNPDATAYDLYIWYENNLTDKLKKMGYETIYLWNDELYRTHDTKWKQVVKMNPDFVIQYWNSDGGFFLKSPETYIKEGYKLVNCSNFYNYFILDPKLQYLGVNPNAIYREYNMNNFVKWNVGYDHVIGSMFCIWADDPSYMKADEILEKLKPLLFYNGLKLKNPLWPMKVSWSRMNDAYQVLYE